MEMILIEVLENIKRYLFPIFLDSIRLSPRAGIHHESIVALKTKSAEHVDGRGIYIGDGGVWCFASLETWRVM